MAMAMRCSTALVEPPRAMATVTAFSKLLRVRMSLGLISALSSSRIAAPARRHSVFLSGSSAGMLAE